MRPRWLLFGSLCTLGLLVLACTVGGVRFNGSPSASYGLYRLHAIDHQLTVGTLVVIPVPPVVQAWHGSIPLLKPVAADEGTLVCAVDGRLWVHGKDYGPVHEEANGRPLPHLDGCLVIPLGMVFLASLAPKSLDSRYFGPVAITQLRAIATPLLTWRGSDAATHY